MSSQPGPKKAKTRTELTYKCGHKREQVTSIGHRHAIHFHLLEPSGTVIDDVKLLQRRHPLVRVSFTIDPCKFADGLPFRNVYYTAARFILAPILLNRGVRRLLIIDINSIMKNSPWPFFDGHRSDQIGAYIFRSRQWKPWKKILASAVFYQSDKASLTFANRVARSILTTIEQSPRYHIDQIIPYFLMKMGGRKLRAKFFDIPHNLMSYHYDGAAAFWTTKGPEKSSEKFTSEKATFEV